MKVQYSNRRICNIVLLDKKRNHLKNVLRASAFDVIFFIKIITILFINLFSCKRVPNFHISNQVIMYRNIHDGTYN